MSFSYVVRIAIDDVRAFDAYVGWLRDAHVGEVCISGARDAELIVLDVPAATPHVVEVRYRFDSRDAFEKYEREEAPRLREQGLAELRRLGLEPGRGVEFTRGTGTTLAWRRL